MADTLISGTTLIENKQTIDLIKTKTSDWDFQVGDLTTDGTVQSLDISGLVPSGTKWAWIRVEVQDDVTNSWVWIGTSNTEDENVLEARTAVANQSMTAQGFVEVPSNRIIYYAAANLTFAALNIKIIAYI